MALLDIFKKKKKQKKAPIPEKKEEIRPPVEKIIKKEIAKPKKGAGIIYDIVKKPHISEKATNLGLVNQYVFEVFPRATQDQIKKTIEGLYGVDVLSVNIVNIPAKKRRLGRTAGFKKGYKKAIVKIGAGQKIEIL